MDNRDTGSLKDNKKMDANTLWQWRIKHVKKYSRHPEPFHYSNKMGLDFNVGSNTQKKLDSHSLTNGVMLEVCDFAETVKRNKWHFITNILENNFDLGLKSEQQRIEFTSQLLHKVRHLIRKPPEDKHEAFTLFDTSSERECTSKDKSRLNMASTEYKTDCFLVDMDESDHKDKLKCSLSPSKDYMKMEEMDGPRADDSDDVDELECSEPQSTEELKEDDVPPSFPCCEEIGLNLDVESKQSLDPGLLTKGMMLELVQFTRTLTASNRSIVLSVLEHNFELDLKRQQEKTQVWFTILQLQKRKKQLLTTGTKISPEFKSEPFSFQTNPLEKGSALSNVGAPLYQFKEVSKRRQSDLKSKREKRALSTTREHVTKRRRTEQAEQEETNTLSHHTDLCNRRTVESDHNYMCPLDSDEATDSENDENEDDLKNPTSSDIHSESESSCVDTHEPFLTTTDGSSSLPNLNPNVNPIFASQPNERGQYGDEEKTEIPKIVPYKCDMEEKEMETESNMWKLRVNRVQQILSLLDKAFTKSKSFGLEFNVGFGPKQNVSVDSLTTSVLLEIAKFALAINSSQQDFIMEILEYNFDFGLWSENHRKTFACELMNRVRQLRNSDDAVKFSKEVFELPGVVSSVNMTRQSMGSVNPEVSSISRTTECDVAPMCPPDLQAENKEHRVDIYPFCKDIGLKLNVICSQPNKKLQINKLTNGAMTEVTNFAEKLCGTFDQICLDILRHNFDLDWQNGDSDLAKTILTQIPIIMEQKNLSTCITASKKIKHSMKDFSTMVMDSQNNPNVDTCSTSSSQTQIIDQNVGSSTDNNQENELNAVLWKLRTNQIQQILSVPHVEHCLFYSFSRCKKLGIDFNVGSGVKQNLDPKLLTNGIMVEINTVATALQSAQKHFITEILEYNFRLNLNNELCRSVFAQQVLDKFRTLRLKNRKSRVLKIRFDLPDSRSIEKSSYPKTKYCHKCYQDRNSKPRQDESDPDHLLHPRPHAMTDTVSTEENCTAQKSAKAPVSTFQVAEEKIMDSYPLCKKIGLILCVDKDKPKDKIDPRVLTRGTMIEVAHFAKRLCGTKHKLINDVLEHNFNFGMQSQDINPALLFHRMVALHNKGPTWFSEVFVVQPYPHKDPGDASKLKEVSAMQKSERKETTKKRKLALQTKEQAPLPSGNMDVVKPKRPRGIRGERFPVCSEIGLVLDVTSQSGDKEKLDLRLLSRTAVVEIYRFAVKKVGHYFPDILYDILDYNFDLSSQHYRRWEFSIATATKVKTMVKRYRKKLERADEVFKLPFVFDPEASERYIQERQNEKSAESSVEKPDKTTNGEGRFVRQIRYHSDVNRVYFLDVKTNEELLFEEEDTKSQTYPVTIIQMTGSPVSGGCDSVLQGNLQIKEEDNGSHHGDMKPELVTEEKYHTDCGDVKTEPSTYDVKYLVQGKAAGSPSPYTFTICSDSEGNIKTESKTEDTHYYILAEPQLSQGYAMLTVCPNTESSVKTECDTEDVKYEIPVEAAGSQGYSMVTICQDTENTLIKEEQKHVPVFIVEMFQSQSEVDIKQEQDS
ncbi:uncharacterized protein LOC111672716 [Seriola lalandi dorsalis]|uniref:uncharacterized protein LOC111672716 n=1 Tax=Seriola lalandi dorsalis TaxID=1841481 RepID=UPI000C6F9517|nr:uncharacterized protein LOC111672716 [Seriola lalandi dorsalis]XP_023286026.1 uncharacterized protein LOC111672716 [Seriola lalandi dorsalis]